MAVPTSCCALPGATAFVSTPVQHAGRARVGCRVGRSWRGSLGGPAADSGVASDRDRMSALRVIAVGHGRRLRRLRRLHDIPAFGAPVELVWRQRYRCVEPACPVRGVSEDHPLAAARAKLTGRAVWWAVSCIQRDTASVHAVARRLGVDWHTVWDAIRPLLAELAGDPDRLVGVEGARGRRAPMAPSAAAREGNPRNSPASWT